MISRKELLSKLKGKHFHKEEITVITGNTGGAISPKKWKDLLQKLEDAGYIGKFGSLPTTFPKCPQELNRYIIVHENNIITFGKPGLPPGESRNFITTYIKVDDFIK